MANEDLFDELDAQPALDLYLEGSVGAFSVGAARTGQNSVEVKYFLTHVGLDFSNTSNDALLSHLAPVREIFGSESLDFDEIMQRDIDDARVSSELIPYLLDEKSADLIKFFPPIVVVVLPLVENEEKPAKFYPKVHEIKKEDDAGKGNFILRSGFPGKEVFQFEQRIKSGDILNHDLARLRINTYKTSLVIIDGQHRAMALLALYRNLKEGQWSSERRLPFKDYYSEWTKNYIQGFQLKEIKLPVILCTFPSLDETYEGDCDLRKASRLIFLTLNKTARKVSDSRNKLLDDSDLIASFMRRCLSQIKQKDSRSNYSLRIFNVELDQFDDKLKIKSPIAVTGVSHLYYMIEHLMLNESKNVQGISSRSGKFYKRKDLESFGCFKRLDGRNLLGSDLSEVTQRDNFTVEAELALADAFMDSYGKIVISALEKFTPFEFHNQAVLALEKRILANQDTRLRPILFEGQGISRVFEAHRTNLRQKIKDDYFSGKVPELESIADQLDGTARRIDDSIHDFHIDRATNYISNVSDKAQFKSDSGKLSIGFVRWLNDLYDNVYTTVAFQSALVCGFWGELEKANREILDSGGSLLDAGKAFSEFISQINDFFIPKTSAHFRRLVKVFTGELSGSIAEWRVIQSNQAFRKVVYRGEMQPDQWPKYKYLMLEIWNPSDEYFRNLVHAERRKCRRAVMSSLYKFQKSTYCQQNMVREESLSDKEIRDVFNTAFNTYSALIKNIGSESLRVENCESVITELPSAEESDDLFDEV
ncbi:DNA sulfur modification protein DndB [Leptolyngbya iicbica]|uniref:DGQHR domain-containing protein n=2 Tax=Cyanophyceae TaxID=3028117 RepID=A0A4Q7E7C3_9CYAN|nr:DNA sulfur modification protein DndB [Leptolyngbya sp. LK]RZM78647.1 hypothetical protein DYY88_07535 [Leptolyngbya sp. LK]